MTNNVTIEQLEKLMKDRETIFNEEQFNFYITSFWDMHHLLYH